MYYEHLNSRLRNKVTTNMMDVQTAEYLQAQGNGRGGTLPDRDEGLEPDQETGPQISPHATFERQSDLYAAALEAAYRRVHGLGSVAAAEEASTPAVTEAPVLVDQRELVGANAR